LLALLLRVAQHDVFDRRRVDAASFYESAHHSYSQIIGADVSKNALLRMGSANRRAAGIDYYSGFHINNKVI
jgi:hypothetical protein